MKCSILSRAILFEGSGPLAHLTGTGFLFKIKRSELFVKLRIGTFSAPLVREPEEDLILVFEQIKTIIRLKTSIIRIRLFLPCPYESS